MKMHSQQFLCYLSLDLSQIWQVGSTFFQRDNKPRHVQSMCLDVSTKNSVDEPSKVTIKFEDRPPCRETEGHN